MPKILWFQLLKCEYLVVFFVVYDSNLNVFEFLGVTLGLMTKQLID